MEATPGGPAAFDRRPTRLYDGQEVVHDSVRDRLVKDAFVAKSLQVHFQALQLDAVLVRNVGKDDRPEVGLPRFWADRRELGTMMFDGKIPRRAGVVKDFQLVSKRFRITQLDHSTR